MFFSKQAQRKAAPPSPNAVLLTRAVEVLISHPGGSVPLCVPAALLRLGFLLSALPGLCFAEKQPPCHVCLSPVGLIPTGFLGVPGGKVPRSIPEQVASRGVGLLFCCSLTLSTRSGTFLGRARLFF